MCVCTQFKDCEMTLKTVAALTELPQWTGSLSFMDCTWPEHPLVYKLFAHSLHTRNSYWVLSGGHSREVAEHLCLGAAEHRKKSGLTNMLCVHSDTVEDNERTEYSNGVLLVPPRAA